VRIVPYDYQPGGAYGICQRCAFKFRLNALRLEWSGLRVCGDCWDPRPDTMTAPVVFPEGLVRPDASPEPPNVFVTGNGPTPGEL
jgi:hypothetical protein